MPAFLTLLFTLYFFASSTILICISALICLCTAPFDRNRKLVHYFSCAWGYHYLFVSPFWRPKIVGRENIDSRKTYVIISNHQSFADILLLYGLFKPYKWVSKESVFKFPFIGWNMYLNQYVSIARGSLKSIKEMLQVCRNWLNRGASILLFPEGTRSPDGQLQAFRDGAFRLAIDCKLPVIPVVIDGTHGMLAKGAKTITFHGHPRAHVLPPVDPEAFKGSSAAMRDHVHKLMTAELVAMRGLPAASAGDAHREVATSVSR